MGYAVKTYFQEKILEHLINDIFLISPRRHIKLFFKASLDDNLEGGSSFVGLQEIWGNLFREIMNHPQQNCIHKKQNFCYVLSISILADHLVFRHNVDHPGKFLNKGDTSHAQWFVFYREAVPDVWKLFIKPQVYRKSV